MRKLPASVLFALAAAACSDPPPDVTALFEVPRAGGAPGEFYGLPFPNDIRRDDAGHPIMDGYPRPVGILDRYLEAIPTLDGFGLNNAIFTRFSGPIDPATLPADAAASLDPAASVYLVDVDPGSAHRGERRPLRFRFQDYAGFTIGPNWLGALPYPGFPLREQTTYALIVTTRLAGAGGGRLLPGADFALIAGTDAVDGELARARARYAPLWTYLDEPGGDERADVVSAAVFTTQSVTGIMGKLRTVVRALPPVEARAVVPVPIENVPFTWYDGVFNAPNFQTGTVPYNQGGDIAFDEGGLPIIQRTEALRFSFTIPGGTMPPGGWPVVIYAHGTGGDYHSFVSDSTAWRMADEGLATISIDQVLHGPRNPDGNPEIDFFNFQNPVAGRNNPIQGAIDDFSVVRLIENFSFEETDPAARTIRFDPDNIQFFGHSQGGLTGPPFLAFEPLR